MTRLQRYISNVLQSIIIFILTTLMAYVLNYYNMQSDSLKLIFMLGVLIVILQTQSFVLTTLVSLAFAATDAYLFIDHDLFDTRRFILSTIIFLVIALLVNVLSLRLQKQMEQSKKNEKVHRELNKASEGLISIQGHDNIIEYADKAMTKLAGTDVEFYFDIPRDDPDEAKKWCLRNSAACGYGEVDYPDSPNKYLPIRTNRKTTGVVALKDLQEEVDETTMDCVYTFVSQVSIAIARNDLEERNKKESAAFAREKIKGTVMKSLSHDMYPRINEIKKQAADLRENQDLMPAETRDEKLSIIEKESGYLADTVDNILEITSR